MTDYKTQNQVFPACLELFFLSFIFQGVSEKEKFKLNKGKSHQVLFQEHFTVRMSLSKVAAAYDTAINFCALGKKMKVIFRAVHMFPDIFNFPPFIVHFLLLNLSLTNIKSAMHTFFFQCVNFFQNVLFNLTTQQ